MDTQWIEKLLKKRILQHVVFWAIYLGPAVISLISAYGAAGILPAASIVGITLSCCYFNLYWLMPRYLFREKLLRYLVYLVAVMLIYTFLWSSAYWLCAKYIFHVSRPLNFVSLYFGNLTDQCIIVALTMALKLGKAWYRQYHRNKELTKQNLLSELQLLKAQINPHFLFNTLNNLYSLTLTRSDHAPEVVLKLSNIMEYMLYDSNEARVPLQTEIKYLQDYIDLERLRQNGKTEIGFEVAGAVKDTEVAPLLLLPFVENAFKHGVNKIASGSKLCIKLMVNDSVLHFTVENSVPEYKKPTLTPSKGLGISNVKKRLELIYPERYRLDILENTDTFKIALNLITI